MFSEYFLKIFASYIPWTFRNITPMFVLHYIQIFVQSYSVDSCWPWRNILRNIAVLSFRNVLAKCFSVIFHIYHENLHKQHYFLNISEILFNNIPIIYMQNKCHYFAYNGSSCQTLACYFWEYFLVIFLYILLKGLSHIFCKYCLNIFGRHKNWMLPQYMSRIFWCFIQQMLCDGSLHIYTTFVCKIFVYNILIFYYIILCRYSQ